MHDIGSPFQSNQLKSSIGEQSSLDNFCLDPPLLIVVEGLEKGNPNGGSFHPSLRLSWLERFLTLVFANDGKLILDFSVFAPSQNRHVLRAACRVVVGF